MRIGIDISQLAYPQTGVANYLGSLVKRLIKQDDKNDYVLFFSTLRGKLDEGFVNEVTGSRVSVRKFKLPPIILDFLWNKLHILPIENFIGDVDIFITSDWTEPPTKKAKKATILYDLIVYKYPKETDEQIVLTQKRKLQWVKKESDAVFCISQSTKKDAHEILGIEEKRLFVTYPGGII